jgi:3-oxoacyl-[acyl-carrier-protein] synthase II
MSRRVVVTGVGAVTPLGVGAGVLMDGWCAGRSGIADGLGRCTDFDPTDFFSKRELKRYDRFTQFALVAADEALAMAGWERDALPLDAERIGCVIGTGSGGLGTRVTASSDFLEGGAGAVSLLQLFIPRAMGNAAASTLSLRFGLQGPAHAVASFCCSGADAIGDAMRMLRLGEVDAMVVGGAEAGIEPLPVAAFQNMGALSESGVSRPFDARRDGFVLGEGAGVLVLEAAEVAEARGAEILGEVLGCASTNDAHDVAQPHPQARGAISALEQALADAGVAAQDVDYVNAHGNAMRDNDRLETDAIKQVLGERAGDVPVSSLKSAIGHLIGGSGAVEAIATLMALQRRVAPPTLNYEQVEEGLDLDYVPEARPLFSNGSAPERPVALSNSFGFGGHNSVLVLAG